MKKDPVDDILKIIEDKYSDRFVYLSNISEYTLNSIFGNNLNMDDNEKIRLFGSHPDSYGTTIVHQYVIWFPEF